MNEPKKIDAHAWPRDPHDWYVESEACSIALFQAEEFNGSIVDPAAGTGRIVRAARSKYCALGFDLIDRNKRKYARYVDDVIGGVDFMADDWTAPLKNSDIVSNPPFSLCAPRGYNWDKPDRAPLFPDLALRRMARKCALFLPAKYVGSSVGRWRWLETTPLKTIYHIVPRPSMPPGDALIAMLKAGKSPGNGYEDFVCLVWERGHKGPPASRMLDISKAAA